MRGDLYRVVAVPHDVVQVGAVQRVGTIGIVVVKVAIHRHELPHRESRLFEG